jgi:hypothetical protein
MSTSTLILCATAQASARLLLVFTKTPPAGTTSGANTAMAPRDCKFFQWQTPTPGDDESQADSLHSLLVTNAKTPVYNTRTKQWALMIVGHAYHGASQREALGLYDAKHGSVNGI